MTTKVKIGISTCPNDTFAFHALLNNRIATDGIQFSFELLDVQELNQRLFAGDFDVAKASFHAAILLANDLAVLSSGSALGFGVGPLLLASANDTQPDGVFTDSNGAIRKPVVACPGEHTTATLLYDLFYPDCGKVQQMVFSEIMPSLQTGVADFGVCIHEGRFTYAEEGLACVCDLGSRWENETDLPLPLGGILVRKSLGEPLMKKIQALVQASIHYGLKHRGETLKTMKRYAQELSDDVLFAHVDTYVNQWTVELGNLGERALETLADRVVSEATKTISIVK